MVHVLLQEGLPLYKGTEKLVRGQYTPKNPDDPLAVLGVPRYPFSVMVPLPHAWHFRMFWDISPKQGLMTSLKVNV